MGLRLWGCLNLGLCLRCRGLVLLARSGRGVRRRLGLYLRRRHNVLWLPLDDGGVRQVARCLHGLRRLAALVRHEHGRAALGLAGDLLEQAVLLRAAGGLRGLLLLAAGALLLLARGLLRGTRLLLGATTLLLEPRALAGTLFRTLAGRSLRLGARDLDLLLALGNLLLAHGERLLVLALDIGQDLALDLLLVRGAGLVAKRRDQVPEAVDRRVHVGHGIAAVRVRPIQNPHRAQQRRDGEHVVLARDLHVKAARVALDGKRAARRDVARDVRLGQELHGHVLQQVRELGVAHAGLERVAGVAQAGVLDDVRKQPIDARGALQVLARHERGAVRHAHARREVLWPNLYALNVHELCHRI